MALSPFLGLGVMPPSAIVFPQQGLSAPVAALGRGRAPR